MLCKTRGIALHSVKYSETSIIVRIYTDQFGLQSYLIKGIRSKRSKIKAGLFQPMTLLDLVAYRKENTGLQSIKEVRIAIPYKTIPFDIRKSSIALFLNELLFKSIREEEKNQELFDFIWNSCLQLDSITDSPVCFHLVFAMLLTRFLGIMPQLDHSNDRPIFNLVEGHFQSVIPKHPHFLDQETSCSFLSISMTPLQNVSFLVLAPLVRAKLLTGIITYYQIHLPGFKGMQSHHVLHNVLS